MPPTRPGPRVALLAHAGHGNLGDEANMAAFIQNIGQRLPEARIIAFTDDADDTRKRHGIPAFPLRGPERRRRPRVATTQPHDRGARGSIRTGLRQSLLLVPGARRAARAGRLIAGLPGAIVREVRFVPYALARLRHVDLLIVAGGGQLGDYFGGPWGYPYTTLKWCALARAMGARVAFVSVGAGPLRASLSRLYVRTAMNIADYRSVRDPSSARLVSRIGVRRETLVYPDPVHGLSLPTSPHGGPGRSSLIVGVNPMPYFDAHYWAEHDEGIYRRHVAVMSGFAAWLIRRGHRVSLFPTQLAADPRVVEDVRRDILASGIPGVAAGILERPVDGFDTLVSAIAEMDIVVSARFHGIVFALQMRKPVIGIAYDPKTSDLMRDAGLGDYVLDIAGLELEALIGCFERLEGTVEPLREEIVAATAGYATRLAEQYDRVLSLVVPLAAGPS